jgi:hypothetical protein
MNILRLTELGVGSVLQVGTNTPEKNDKMNKSSHEKIWAHFFVVVVVVIVVEKMVPRTHSCSEGSWIALATHLLKWAMLIKLSCVTNFA